MEKVNREQLIRNLNHFGPVSAYDVIIVVQVHDRLEHLKLLIESLEKVSFLFFNIDTKVSFSSFLLDRGDSNSGPYIFYCQTSTERTPMSFEVATCRTQPVFEAI